MKKRRKDARPTVGAVKRAAEAEANNHESPDCITIVSQGDGFVKSGTYRRGGTG